MEADGGVLEAFIHGRSWAVLSVTAEAGQSRRVNLDSDSPVMVINEREGGHELQGVCCTPCRSPMFPRVL